MISTTQKQMNRRSKLRLNAELAAQTFCGAVVSALEQPDRPQLAIGALRVERWAMRTVAAAGLSEAETRQLLADSEEIFAGRRERALDAIFQRAAAA